MATILVFGVMGSVALAIGPLSPRESFYRLEAESWREYVERFEAASEDTTFDVTFYDIDVDIAVDRPYIEGRVRSEFAARKDGLGQITLQLHRALDVDSLSGNVKSFVHTGDTIRVELDRIYARDESASVTVYYHGEPELLGDTKGLRYETHGAGEVIVASLSTPFLAHMWWPCKDGPGDKADSVYIDIAIPDTMVAGRELIATSNGTLDGVARWGGKKVFRWRERHPIVPYYVMVAISNYRHHQQIYVQSDAESFPLDYYIFNEDYAEALDGVERMPEVMALFESLFGPYPFSDEKYAMSQLGYYGGIENQTNTIINQMGSSWFEVSVHELAHMWFADMITCRDWHHGWLNEGFATYAEALWIEADDGRRAYLREMRGNEYFDGETLYLDDVSDPFGVFLSIIYRKGAHVLHMLRGVLGDEAFFGALRAYALEPGVRFGHAVTEDFRAVCEAVSGRDLDFFFAQWVYDEYYPIYRHAFSQDPVTRRLEVTIEQIQVERGRREVFEMPIQLRLNFESGGDSLVTVWNDQRRQEFPLDVGRAVTSMELDPDRWILREAAPVGIEDPGPPGPTEGARLAQNRPNPFNPTTFISFEVPPKTAGLHPVVLSIHDLRGARIRTLVERSLAPGVHRVTWDGRGDDGQAVASGIYVYRLRVDDQVRSRRMVLAK